MLIRLRFDDVERPERTLQLHGELPKSGSIIEVADEKFAVSAIPTTWVLDHDELIPVLHVLPKAEQVPV